MINNKTIDEIKLYWSKENLPTDFSILMEKLSGSNSLDVRKLYNEYKNITNDNKVSGKKKKIIENNIKSRQETQYKDDKIRIKNFVKELDNYYENWLDYIITEKGKNELKIIAHKKCLKTESIRKLDLLLQINPIELSDSDRFYYEKEYSKIKKLNLKRIQLKCLGNRLPPLDYFNNPKLKLETWQIEVIDNIKNHISTLVCAPTSSGKTILSTFFAQIGKRIIYIVPSKPLAFQVAAIFSKITGNNLSLFVDDFSYQSIEPQIIIGTPYEIESKIPYILNCKIDLAVYDEIHNLNYKFGDSYERIIKLLDIDFLALSATIVNPEDIINWYKKVYPDKNVKSVEYNRRFINTQRYIWDDKMAELIRLHPFSCYSEKFWENTNACEDINLPFTPLDSFSVWESINKINPKLGKINDPEKIFKMKKRLDLNDSKFFEDKIKKTINSLSSEEKISLRQTFDMKSKQLANNIDIYKFALKLKKMFSPAIIFNHNQLVCMDIFKTLIEKLETEEINNYPFYYNDLEYKNKLYSKYREKRNELEATIREDEKYDKLQKYDEKSLFEYHEKLNENYKKNLNKLQKMLHNLNDYEINYNKWDEITIKKQINLLSETKDIDMSTNSLEDTDIFQKHPDFSFTRLPMKAHQIRKIRKKITSKIGYKINYTNCLIQGLKRGIGIYTKNLPDVYLRVVQEMAQNKELGIVISDDSLALGINMPFKSVVILGWGHSKEVDTLIYNQMIGRAGRRGLDVEGNVIYANVDWKSMINTPMPKIKGIKNFVENYSYFPNYNKDIIKVGKNFLYDTVNKIESQNNNVLKENNNILSTSYTNIIWKLRNYGIHIIMLVNFLDNLELHIKDNKNPKMVDFILYDIINIINYGKKSEYNFEANRKINLAGIEFNNIYESISKCHIHEKLDEINKYKLIEDIRLLGNIFKICYNSLLDENIPYTLKILKILFNKCKQQVYNYLQLNSN